MNESWLEVSLIVNGELAEAVSEVLARFANGVAIESTAVTAGPDDSEGHEVGPLRVVAYLPVDDQLEETRRKLEEALWYLGRIRPLPQAQFRQVQEADWAEAWKEHYHPITIGERLIIVPAWLESPEPGRIPICMDPGMAFGTGTHPTTQLCLEALEAAILAGVGGLKPLTSLPSGFDVLDIGCGSGILAVAALKLGARRAVCVDIDAYAVNATRENAERNGVQAGLQTGTGSVAEVKRGGFEIQRAALVLANILAPVLVRLLEEGLDELLLPGGVLILSGILDVQAGDVISAAEKVGLRLVDRRQSADWVALGFTR